MYRYIGFIVAFMLGLRLFAQTPSQPLELPNFIIEGKEQIDVQVGTKQIPSYSTLLERNAIDSLIIVGKPRNYIVFPTKFPNTIISKSFPDGYLIGNVGSFLTLNANAGYRTNIKGYDVFSFGAINASKGHVENADYLKLQLGLQTDYIAPEKFYIFGGSKTTTNVDFDFKSYKLYALTDPPSRNLLSFNAKIVSIGDFEGYAFETGAKLGTANQSGAGNGIGENCLGGFLKVVNKSYSNNIGGKISLDFRSFENNSTNFFEFVGFAKFDLNDTKIEPSLGFQLARSSTGETRPMILVSATATKQIHQNISLWASISNKLNNIGFIDFIKQNPYLSDSLIIDFANEISFQGKAKYQPNKDLAFTFNAQYSIFKRRPTFSVIKYGYFNIQYPDANIFTASIEGYFTNPIIGTISGLFAINSTSILSNKGEVPNIPSFKLRADYSKKLFKNILFGAFFEFVGRRYADIENRFSLDSFNNLGFKADYIFNSSMIFTINVENLLNSNIVNWYGYKEWGFNFKVGLTYKF
ncbi:MAG: hypothetical protein CH6_0473 [Candidatus Kapaibacterium sp.]|nr:MAG: hypothetical protein CH6_0473 [Candidatus Kapabacteria bacterium]